MTDYRKLGRQDADFDNTLAESAECVPPPPQPELSLLFIAACVVLPLGLFVLAGALLHRHFKEKTLGTYREDHTIVDTAARFLRKNHRA